MSGNQFGGCGFSIVSGQTTGIELYIHTDIYIHIYIYDIYIYIYMRFIHWMCGVFRSLADTAHTRRHIPIGGSVADKGGVTYIAAHSSPTRRRGVALPEMVLQSG